MKSWRALTTAWLRERQPGIEFHEIDASVGGTGSDYACCRMATDVVDHRPDLVFVEFAVNDAQTPALRRHRGYEGVIRSLCRALPKADIIAVHTMGEGFLADYDRGALPGSVACHQRICDHYGVPTINVGDALRRHMARSGKQWSDYFSDGCHPSDAGHAHYAGTVRDALLTLPAGATRVLPKPLDDRAWRDGRIVTGDLMAADSQWKRDRRFVWATDMRLLQCSRPGATLTIPFEGSVVGLLCLRHAMSGSVWWSVDDAPDQRCVIWDEYCPLFERAGYLVLADELPPGAHVLRLRVDGEPASPVGGTSLDLYGIMTARHLDRVNP